MKLPVHKQLTYISPSTYMSWKSCQYKVYASRLAGHPYMQSKQGKAAAIGSAFDLLAKQDIAKELGIKSPILEFGVLNKQVQSKDVEERAEIFKRAQEAYVAYKKSRFIETLMAEENLKLEHEMYRIVHGIPMLGRLDAIVDNVPFDWKLRGFNSKSTASPTKGWNRYYQNGNHKTGETDPDPLEKNNWYWAVQMTFYNWLLCNEKFTCVIHEILDQKRGMVIVEHKRFISDDFVHNLFLDVQKMWECIHGDLYDADIAPPSPSPEICHAYGQLCEAACVCNAYARHSTEWK